MQKLAVVLVLSSLLIILVLVLYFRCRKRSRNASFDVENSSQRRGDETEFEDLVVFRGGEDLTIGEILDAPGEVIGKSSYGTLYKALLQRSSEVKLLRFLRPVCAVNGEEFDDVIQLLGCVRHPNLVPLLGFYSGSRGEKLLIHHSSLLWPWQSR